jgi:hypothetical protein
MTEAVEKVSCQGARGFARFDFTGDERHQRLSQRPDSLSGQGFDCICRSSRVDDAEYRSVGKKFRALGRQLTFFNSLDQQETFAKTKRGRLEVALKPSPSQLIQRSKSVEVLRCNYVSPASFRIASASSALTRLASF